VLAAGTCALVVLLAAGLYLNTLHNPFVYDDFRTVVDNGSIASLSNITAIVMHETTRPLTNLSLAIDRAIWGGNPFGFHVTNVALHGLNVVLVFLMAASIWSDQRSGRARQAGGTMVAAVAATLFAAHPMMTEAVGYISSRSDVLCASLMLLAFLAARTWITTGGRLMLLCVWLSWLAALMAKETAAMFPLVVLAYSRLRTANGASASVEAGSEAARTKTLVLPLGLVMVWAAVVRLTVFIWLERGEMTVGWRSVAAMLPALWQYGTLLAIPSGQTIFHEAVPVVSVTEPRLVWSAAACLLGVAALWRHRMRVPVAIFGASWFVLLLAPALALASAADSGAVAEHRAYVPAAGLFLMVGALCAEFTPLISRFRSTRILAPLACAAVVLMLSGRTYIRNMVWASPIDLWQEAVMHAPGHWLPRAALGESLHAAGRHAEAIASFRESLVRWPENESAAVNLVVCLAEESRPDEASAVVDTLARLRPQSAAVTIGRGAIAAINGQPAEARAQFLEAIRRDPGNVMARQWLAVLAEEGNDRAEALHRCYELQRLAPGRASIESCIERMRSTP
jgi:Flp pilus assembly protein TadD